MDEVESRLKVDCNDCIPLTFGHLKHKTILGNTCVVHQNIDLAEISHDLVYNSVSLLEIGSVGSISLYLMAKSLDLGYSLLSIFVDYEVSDCSLGSEFQGDCLANSSGGARYKGYLSF